MFLNITFAILFTLDCGIELFFQEWIMALFSGTAAIMLYIDLYLTYWRKKK